MGLSWAWRVPDGSVPITCQGHFSDSPRVAKRKPGMRRKEENVYPGGAIAIVRGSYECWKHSTAAPLSAVARSFSIIAVAARTNGTATSADSGSARAGLHRSAPRFQASHTGGSDDGTCTVLCRSPQIRT
jgi:hypothetical protein